MFKKLIDKKTKKLFSNSYLKNVKKNDYFEYIQMQESILESLKSQKIEAGLDNDVLDNEILKKEYLIKKLNHFYYELMSKPEHFEPEVFYDDITIENKKIEKELKQIQDKYIKYQDKIIEKDKWK